MFQEHVIHYEAAGGLYKVIIGTGQQIGKVERMDTFAKAKPVDRILSYNSPKWIESIRITASPCKSCYEWTEDEMTKGAPDLEGKGPAVGSIRLREVIEEDLPTFFEQQLDEEANYMAAFTREDPADRDGFLRHWHKILDDETIKIRSILFKGQLAGSILSHAWFGEPEVSYWLGKEFWGKGIATQALALFLEAVKERPLYARTAKDNIASLRVLEKCGFRISGEDKGFANARGEEVEEYILTLR